MKVTADPLAEKIFYFGLTADKVDACRRGIHDPHEIRESDGELRRVLDGIAGGAFSTGDRDAHRAVVDALPTS